MEWWVRFAIFLSGTALVLLILWGVMASLHNPSATKAAKKAPFRSPGRVPGFHLTEAWFDEIASGRKTVEGRLGGWGVQPGDTVWIYKGHSPYFAFIRCRVAALRHYKTLDEFLDGEWEQAAPQAGSREKARAIYLGVRFMNGKGRQVFSPRRVKAKKGIEAADLVLI